jgi:hypothetical protein
MAGNLLIQPDATLKQLYLALMIALKLERESHWRDQERIFGGIRRSSRLTRQLRGDIAELEKRITEREESNYVSSGTDGLQRGHEAARKDTDTTLEGG